MHILALKISFQHEKKMENLTNVKNIFHSQVKKIIMNNINSLYQLIKKTSQEKGRPLKVICD